MRTFLLRLLLLLLAGVAVAHANTVDLVTVEVTSDPTSSGTNVSRSRNAEQAVSNGRIVPGSSVGGFSVTADHPALPTRIQHRTHT